jgi:hypothetical protein
VGNAKFQISSTKKTKLEIVVQLPLACKISKVGMEFTRVNLPIWMDLNANIYKRILKYGLIFLKISKIINPLCRKVQKFQIQRQPKSKPWAM